MSAIAVCSPRSQPSCQPIASRHAIAMPSQAARSATRTGSPRAWRRPAPPRASGRRVNASTRCTRRRSPAPRCTLARHTRRQAAGPRGGARRTAPATRARTRCLARGGACARAVPATNRRSDSTPQIRMLNAVNAAVVSAAHATVRQGARGDQHEREQQRHLRLRRQQADAEAGPHRPTVGPADGQRRARRGEERVLPEHPGDEHARGGEQRERADAPQAGERAEPRYARCGESEHDDAERDEQRVADCIGQQRQRRHEQQVGGRVQPRDEVFAAELREQLGRQPREGRQIVRLPRRAMQHHVRRRPEHRVVGARARRRGGGRVTDDGDPDRDEQRVARERDRAVRRDAPGCQPCADGRGRRSYRLSGRSMRRARSYLTDAFRAAPWPVAAGCAVRRRAACVRLSGNCSSCDAGCTAASRCA